MVPDRPPEASSSEESVVARDMNEHKEARAEPETAPTVPNASVPGAGVVWVRVSPSQVMRTKLFPPRFQDETGDATAQSHRPSQRQRGADRRLGASPLRW